MNYQKIILVGNATKDAQRQTSKKGDVEYTTFRLGVSDSKDRPMFFSVSVFGKHGEAVAKYVTRGRQVLVEGRIEVSKNGYFNVVANRVVFGNSILEEIQDAKVIVGDMRNRLVKAKKKLEKKAQEVKKK